MHVLFDTTNARAIARHASYNALAALAVIQFANVDTRICRCGENKNYAWLEASQITSVLHALGAPVPPKGTKYNELVRMVREAVEATEWLLLPFTTEQLITQAQSLGAKEDRPYAIGAGDAPELVQAWHCDPQRNVKREDSSYWVTVSASGGAAVYAEQPSPPAAGTAKRSPSARSGPRAPTGTPTPREPRAAASGPATRPKAGTSTGKVWDVADACKARGLEGKELRAAVIAECEALAINSSTASVQFGKWKSSQ